MRNGLSGKGFGIPFRGGWSQFKTSGVGAEALEPKPVAFQPKSGTNLAPCR